MTDPAIKYSASRRRFLRDATLTSLGLVAAACAPTPGGGTPTGGTSAKGGEFHGAWPYVLPPQGHYNYFATNGILFGSIYSDLFVPTLGVYLWNDNKSWNEKVAVDASEQ